VEDRFVEDRFGEGVVGSEGDFTSSTSSKTVAEEDGLDNGVSDSGSPGRRKTLYCADFCIEISPLKRFVSTSGASREKCDDIRLLADTVGLVVGLIFFRKWLNTVSICNTGLSTKGILGSGGSMGEDSGVA
jgi:hypothetical protein